MLLSKVKFSYSRAPRQARTTSYVALHYTDEAGHPKKLRATPEHLVYLAPQHLVVNKPVAQLPTGGAASRTDMVQAGDLLAVRSQAQEGGFYLARVTAVTRWDGCFDACACMFCHAYMHVLLTAGGAVCAWPAASLR